MKYWQKIFLCTLVLFVTAINAAAFALADTAYQSAIDSERERIANDFGFISGALCRDMERAGANLSDEAVASVYRAYNEYYLRQGVYINLTWGGKSAVAAPFAVSADGEDIKVGTREYTGETYMYAVGGCGADREVAIAQVIESTVQRGQALKLRLVLLTTLISFVLAAALIIILKRLTRPIKRLNAVTNAFSRGELAVRANAIGHDELSELAVSFNSMADELARQMTALEADAARKQRFIDDMAHELRTPLTAISGYSQYLSTAAVTEDERLSALMYIRRESARLSGLSNKLLLLAKLREGSAQAETVDMRALFLDIEYALADAAKSRGVELAFESNNVKWLTDGELIYTIVQNLASNAIRACVEGGHVELAADKAKIVVKDDGRGMDAETLRHIAEPFYRADKARSREQGGAGLGLSICSGAARLLGLELRFESELGRGTRAELIRPENAPRIAECSHSAAACNFLQNDNPLKTSS